MLSKGSVLLIFAAVDRMFDRIKARYLGPNAVEVGDKRIEISYRPEYTLQGLYQAAATEEKARPSWETAGSLVQLASAHLDATRERTKALVVKEVDAFLRDAKLRGIDTSVETVLGGKLAEVWGKAETDVRRILDAEATHATNIGLLEGITRVNALSGIEDPVVYFVTAHDRDVCVECERLHLMPNGHTPRLWLMSEVVSGYHKRGEEQPSWSGLHPHCRCRPASLMPGYGFGRDGLVKWIGRHHNEFENQRS